MINNRLYERKLEKHNKTSVNYRTNSNKKRNYNKRNLINLNTVSKKEFRFSKKEQQKYKNKKPYYKYNLLEYFTSKYKNKNKNKTKNTAVV